MEINILKLIKMANNYTHDKIIKLQLNLEYITNALQTIDKN